MVVSVCRAHLVPSETEPNKHTLLWVCPEGVDPPSDMRPGAVLQMK